MENQVLIEAYENEISYQKHMIDNLGRWFALFFLVSSIGAMLAYLFHNKNLILLILGVVLILLGILGMMLFSYGINKGKKNIAKVIDSLERAIK